MISLATIHTTEENTIICSPDKDVLKQCIGMHYNYGKGVHVPDEALKFLWVQVLMGDSTDNIVGIPGVGIKTAENWLKDRTKDFESFAIRKYVESSAWSKVSLSSSRTSTSSICSRRMKTWPVMG